MKEVKLTIYKILAVGSNKSFMWVKEIIKPIFISRHTYYFLKDLGVPTSQSLRKKK